jgi:hypothetical protein
MQLVGKREETPKLAKFSGVVGIYSPCRSGLLCDDPTGAAGLATAR